MFFYAWLFLFFRLVIILSTVSGIFAIFFLITVFLLIIKQKELNKYKYKYSDEDLSENLEENLEFSIISSNKFLRQRGLVNNNTLHIQDPIISSTESIEL